MSTSAEPAESGLTVRKEPLPITSAVLWGPTNAGPPQPLGQPYPIFLHQKPIRQLIVHTRSAPTKTLLGFLLGEVYECPETGIRYLVIDESIRVGAEVAGDKTSTLLAQVWPRLQQSVQSQKRQLIGWYHSHPTGTAALTREDVGVHLMYFTQPWQVGLVLGMEAGKPAAGWFRAGQDDKWSTTPLAFYEVLAADSVDSSGKKHSHIDWANFKPYKAVPPPRHKSVAVPRPAPAAAPAATTARTRAVPVAPTPAPKPPAPAPPAAPPAPPPRPAAPRVSVSRAAPPSPPPEEEVEEVEEPVPERPARVSGLARAPTPPRVEEPPEEEEPAEEPVEEPRERPVTRPPARRSVAARRPFVPTVEPRAEAPAARPAPKWHVWAAGAGGAAAMALLVVAGWGIGLVHFGRMAGSASPQAAPAESGAPPATPVNPALVLMDQFTDSVMGSVRVYRQRGAGFDAGRVDCAALAQALVVVEGHWMAYNSRGKPRDVLLDAQRAARDQSLYAQVDTVESHFDKSACPRP